MPNRTSLLLTAALVLGPSAALAQTPASASVAPLTVQGAAPPKVIREQAFSFAQLYTTGTPKLDLIGRWREPICVQVVNLAPEQAAMVKERIEEVARGVGLPTAKPGCTSNIQVVLTSQPQAFVDKAAKADDHVLGFHYRSDTNRVKAVTRPIQAWYKTATQSGHFGHDGLPFAFVASDAALMGATGDQATAINPGHLAGETQVAETVDIPENRSPPGCAGSLINHCERSVFKNVLMVIDSRAAANKPLGPLADYLAMMALSQARSLDGCGAFPSIFDLMAKSPCPGRDPPDGLTSADAAMLTALYASAPETRAASMQVEIADRMAEMLIKANAPAKAAK